MAQLIKLKDYVSRYEWNIYRYPTQYIRMKQENWKKLYAIWRQEAEEQIGLPVQEQSVFRRWKQLFKHKEEDVEQNETTLPNTEDELKQYFLNRLFSFQLKWASSTVMDVSFIEPSFETDPTLQYFLQRFPDIYFVMYYPIFKIQHAPVDGEILLLGPLGLEIIHLLEFGNGNETIYAVDNRTWIIATEQEQKRIISPEIALKRTEKIVKSMLRKQEVDFPVTKTILSRSHPIDLAVETYNLNIVDKRNYESWFQEKRHLASPLKNQQLQTADALLKHCQTTSVKRPEW